MTPKVVNIFQKEHEEKQQEEYDKADYISWLNGLYVLRAIDAAMSKNGKYPEEPLRISDSKEEKQEDSALAAVRFADWARQANKAFQEKGR